MKPNVWSSLRKWVPKLFSSHPQTCFLPPSLPSCISLPYLYSTSTPMRLSVLSTFFSHNKSDSCLALRSLGQPHTVPVGCTPYIPPSSICCSSLCPCSEFCAREIETFKSQFEYQEVYARGLKASASASLAADWCM